jgi:hypothetical protein
MAYAISLMHLLHKAAEVPGDRSSLGLEGALQEALRSLEGSFKASAPLRHLRMKDGVG